MIILEPRNMHWVGGSKDDEKDLCAHGNIFLEVNGITLVDGKTEDFTVSAAAIFLLRTLETDYIKDSLHENQIFPCCGFYMAVDEHSENAIIPGCFDGVDFDVLHEFGNIRLLFDDKEYIVSEKEWCEAILHFSALIKAFYNSCRPKVVDSNDFKKAGYERFLSEWDRRVKAAKAVYQD
ncbi:hypothetical protein JR338_10600 [Chloroflexota bacterium]|nr:hypothetical protein JR338_10600 [Chloroflexota bacterium]